MTEPRLPSHARSIPRRSRLRRYVRPTGMVLAAALSLSVFGTAAYAWATFSSINKNVTRVNVAVGSQPTSSTGTAQPRYDGKDQNILLVGNDDRRNLTAAERKSLKVGNGDGSDSTDTMLIIHIPADGAKATLISLPRDSYVNIPGYSMNKLNAAYVDGYNSVTSGSQNDHRSAGANLLISTVEQLTGLTIDHYVQVSLLGFVDISNAIGGVPINLCESTDDTAAYNKAHGESGGSGFKMSKGKHVIKGITALEFVRQRHNFPNDAEDLDRVLRQQYFLASAFRQVASVGILFKLQSLGSAIEKNVYLDKSLNLLDLAKQMENLSANNIVGFTIPTTVGTVGDMDVLKVSPKKVQAAIKNLLEPPAAPSSGSSGTPSSSPSTSPSSSPSTSTSPSPSASSSSSGAIDSKCVY